METVQIINSILTPLIAIIAVYIAYQQYLTNRKSSAIQNTNNKRKLKLDLFEKRYKIFEETQHILIEIIQKGGIETSSLQIFSAKTRNAYFLFDKEVVDFIENIIKFNIDLYSYSREEDQLLMQNIDIKTSKAHEEKWKLIHWFIDQSQHVENLFLPYLDFKKLD